MAQLRFESALVRPPLNTIAISMTFLMTRRRRQFSLCASRLADLSSEHDLGVSYSTDAENWPKVQIALAAARYVSKLITGLLGLP
jgi:hypothetical protein